MKQYFSCQWMEWTNFLTAGAQRGPNFDKGARWRMECFGDTHHRRKIYTSWNVRVGNTLYCLLKIYEGSHNKMSGFEAPQHLALSEMHVFGNYSKIKHRSDYNN